MRSRHRFTLAVIGLSLIVCGSVAAQDTVFRYSFFDDTPLPLVPDQGPAGNDATAEDGALISPDIPEIGLPDDAGDASLDSGSALAGAVTNAPLLLSNASIADAGGFTIECWFKWNGAGVVNSVIDYAGTEKIVVQQQAGDDPNERILMMRFNDGAININIGVVGTGEWHYVAVVFDTLGAPLNGDGTVTGDVTVYLDGLGPAGKATDITKSNFGDSLNRPIGIGQHPLGFANDYLDGLVFEPRVTLGALAPEDLLLDTPVPSGPAPVFHYKINDNLALPVIPDSSPAGNDATAGAQTAIVADVPVTAPDDAGNSALDTSGQGAATNNTGLLSNEEIEAAGGFSMEAWFKWNGGGNLNSIIDYATTEKIVLDEATDPRGQVMMVFNEVDTIPIGIAIPDQWHYVAVVFNTGGRPREADGSIQGSVSVFFDGTTAATLASATKGTIGDEENLEIGIGEDPFGSAGSIFDGLIYEPRVYLGAWTEEDLSYTLPAIEPGTLFRYSFSEEPPLPAIPDSGPLGNGAIAGGGALISEDIPEIGVPDDAGDFSLDTAASILAPDPPSGAVTSASLLLSNAAIAETGGFTMECWFKWNGAGVVNSVIDYAGTEKIVVQDQAGPDQRMVEMRIAGTGDVAIGPVGVGEWHYVAAVFDTLGQDLNADGTINGTVTVYLDSLLPANVQEGALKDNFGDSLNRPIGIGQHPLGFANDFFDGLVFEPRVSLGPLPPQELLFEGLILEPAETLVHYSFTDTTPLPTVPDQGPAGNDGTAGAGAALSTDIPGTTPDGAGNASLDSSGAGSSGVVTNAQGLLNNDAVAIHAGFTMETWFKWQDGGQLNSIIDYAGTERIIIDTAAATRGQVEFSIDGVGRIPIGVATAGQWHYVAVVFDSGGSEPDGNGDLTGSVTVYFDSFTPVSTTDDITKTTTGDDRDLGLGFGQQPAGDPTGFFDGLIYEPKVTLGPLNTNDLSFVMPRPDPVTVFHYSFEFGDPLFPQIEDQGPAGNDGLAGPEAVLTVDIPTDGVPASAGDASLDSSGAGDTGAVTNQSSLLTNALIVEAGGFTMEAWLRWADGGQVNSVIDYAGTEKIVVQAVSPDNPGNRLVAMRIAGTPADIVIGETAPNEWHYAAVVFDTGGAGLAPDGSVSGEVTVYFDGIDPVGTSDARKDTFGDSLNRPIGVGKHPLGFANDFFVGQTFEPRVTLGALRPDELLYGSEIVCPEEGDAEYGDTACSNISVVGPGTPGIYTATATATDDTGDTIRYTFTADDGDGALLTVGPQTSNTAQFDLGVGTWTVSVTVDDDPRCDDEGDSATCSTEVTVNLVSEFMPIIRGDANTDGAVNISDASFILNFLFLGGPDLQCTKAGDANSDDSTNISDASYILNFLFLGGPDIGPPNSCEEDSGIDEGDPDCASFTFCDQ